MLAETIPLSFSPALPWPILAGAFVLLCAIAGYYYWQLKPILSKGWWRWLVAAKAVSIALLFIALARPSFHSSTPDDRDFTTIFLIDASRSMGTADCDSRRRIDIVKESMTHPDSSFYKRVIAPYKHHSIVLFSDATPRPIPDNTDFTLLPGNTDIDAAIRHSIRGNTTRKRRIGTIVLATDGNDNTGTDILSVSEELRAQGIPLSCIGVGDPRPAVDVAVAFAPLPEKVVKGRPFELTAALSGRLSANTTLDLRLFENDRMIQSRKVTQDAGRFAVEESFELTSFLTGLRTYKIEVTPLGDEVNIHNNRDYAGVEIHPPDLFRCLYVSHALTWDFKYLKRLADNEDKLELSAIVRIAKDNWMTYGLKNTELKGIPEPQTLNTFDCVIVDLEGVDSITEESWAHIAGFVENRGGGAIFVGLPSALPSPLANLMPVKQDNVAYKRLGKSPIEVSSTSLLFNRSRNDASELRGIFLPEETPFLDVRKSQVKRAASTGALVEDSDLVLVSGHNIGAGKTALVTIPDSWKWFMNSDAGRDQYALFWGRLISWSATGPKERLVMTPGSSTVALNEPLPIKVTLLNETFTPDSNAKVTATITAPDETVKILTFFNNPNVDGQYIQSLIAAQPGVYTARVRIETAKGEALETSAEYMFVDQSPETGVRPMAEGVLQNIAQLTGGRYWRYDELSSIDQLPLSTNVQMKHTTLPLNSLWWFFLAVAFFFLPDWALRRRIGLR